MLDGTKYFILFITPIDLDTLLQILRMCDLLLRCLSKFSPNKFNYSTYSIEMASMWISGLISCNHSLIFCSSLLCLNQQAFIVQVLKSIQCTDKRCVNIEWLRVSNAFAISMKMVIGILPFSISCRIRSTICSDANSVECYSLNPYWRYKNKFISIDIIVHLMIDDLQIL